MHNSKKTRKTMTFADKTSNMHRLIKEEHNRLLRKATNSEYKKDETKIKDKINKNGKEILKTKEVLNQREITEESNYFLTLKDNKEKFQNNPTVRPINPAKIRLEELAKLF